MRHVRGFGPNESGFSLVELMVVVGLIGIITLTAIPNYKGFLEKARRARAISEMSSISRALQGYRTLEDRSLRSVVDQDCPSCDAAAYADIDPGIGNDSAKILNVVGFAGKLDPWGHPYILDSNENEFPPDDCRYDSIWSRGPDGVWEGPGDGDDCAGDDVIIRVPFRFPNSCKPFDAKACNTI